MRCKKCKTKYDKKEPCCPECGEATPKLADRKILGVPLSTRNIVIAAAIALAAVLLAVLICYLVLVPKYSLDFELNTTNIDSFINSIEKENKKLDIKLSNIEIDPWEDHVDDNDIYSVGHKQDSASAEAEIKLGKGEAVDFELFFDSSDMTGWDLIFDGLNIVCYENDKNDGKTAVAVVAAVEKMLTKKTKIEEKFKEFADSGKDEAYICYRLGDYMCSLEAMDGGNEFMYSVVKLEKD